MTSLCVGLENVRGARTATWSGHIIPEALFTEYLAKREVQVDLLAQFIIDHSRHDCRSLAVQNAQRALSSGLYEVSVNKKLRQPQHCASLENEV